MAHGISETMQACMGTKPEGKHLHNKPNRLYFYEDRAVTKANAGRNGDVSEAELFYTQTDLLPPGKSILDMQQINPDIQSYMGEAFDKTVHATRRASSLWNQYGNQNIITTRATDIQFQHDAGTIIDANSAGWGFTAVAGATLQDTWTGITSASAYDADNPLITMSEYAAALSLEEITEAVSDGTSTLNHMYNTGTSHTYSVEEHEFTAEEFASWVLRSVSDTTLACGATIDLSSYSNESTQITGFMRGVQDGTYAGVYADDNRFYIGFSTATSASTSNDGTCVLMLNKQTLPAATVVVEDAAVGSTFTVASAGDYLWFRTVTGASYATGRRTVTWTGTYTIQSDGTVKLTELSIDFSEDFSPSLIAQDIPNAYQATVDSTFYCSGGFTTLTAAQASAINTELADRASGTDGYIWCLDLAEAKKYQLGDVAHLRSKVDAIGSSRVLIDEQRVGLGTGMDASIAESSTLFNTDIWRNLWRVGHQIGLTLLSFNPTYRTAALIDDTATQADQAFAAYTMFRDLIMGTSSLATKTIAVLRNTYNLDTATATCFKQLLDALVTAGNSTDITEGDLEGLTGYSYEILLGVPNIQNVCDVIYAQTYTGCTDTVYLAQARTNACLLYLNMVRLFMLQLLGGLSDIDIQQLCQERCTLLGLKDVTSAS